MNIIHCICFHVKLSTRLCSHLYLGYYHNLATIFVQCSLIDQEELMCPHGNNPAQRTVLITNATYFQNSVVGVNTVSVITVSMPSGYLKHTTFIILRNFITWHTQKCIANAIWYAMGRQHSTMGKELVL